MDSQRLRNSLIQTLENYQRTGLRRFSSSQPSDETLALVKAVMDNPNVGATSSMAASRDESVQPIAPATPVPAPDGAHARPAMAPAATAQSSPAQSMPPQPAATPAESISTPGSWTLPLLDSGSRQTQFDQLDAQIKACRACANIVDYRRQTVFGTGPLHPQVCFMGEAPGADEDRLGVPFVGKAGQLLTKIIAAMKLSRDDVFILNALKCRPPQNRTPVPEEIEACRGYVESQLEVLQPKYIVCLGAVAVRSILQSNLSIGRLRGQFHSYRGAQVVVTYHPSYLLRNADAKRLVWDDMKMLMREMGIEV